MCDKKGFIHSFDGHIDGGTKNIQIYFIIYQFFNY